jgi:hypothetical protein
VSAEEHGEEPTKWIIGEERLVDDTRRLNLSLVQVELPDGIHFEQYVLRMPKASMVRKYVYGKTREEVHDKWIKLHQETAQGPVATTRSTVGTYVHYWLNEIVKPNLAPKTVDVYELFVRV